MKHFAGLDVSVNETSVCVVDDTGKIVREVKVASEPGARCALAGRRLAHSSDRADVLAHNSGGADQGLTRGDGDVPTADLMIL